MTNESTSILVLCTGNSCRSQMAEGFFRELGRGNIEAHSAGTEPQHLNPHAVTVMKEAGIDISRQVSKHVGGYLGRTFDYVITVCDNAAENCPTFPGKAERIHWPFDDPAKATGTEDEILGEFRRVRDEIKARIESWLSERKSA